MIANRRALNIRIALKNNGSQCLYSWALIQPD
uniref:Uncharacterized protein n=1 Tax=Arundo donax TaxID=35708 RepID=A0A0A8Z4U5_ARUDO